MAQLIDIHERGQNMILVVPEWPASFDCLDFRRRGGEEDWGDAQSIFYLIDRSAFAQITKNQAGSGSDFRSEIYKI